jgi:hypothetical protein
MLTDHGRFEREWGRYPELAKVLADKQIKTRWTGPSSVSDSIFDHVIRLLRIYALVSDNDSDIAKALAIQGQSMFAELSDLADGLDWAACQFSEASREVRKLASR